MIFLYLISKSTVLNISKLLENARVPAASKYTVLPYCWNFETIGSFCCFQAGGYFWHEGSQCREAGHWAGSTHIHCRQVTYYLSILTSPIITNIKQIFHSHRKTTIMFSVIKKTSGSNLGKIFSLSWNRNKLRIQSFLLLLEIGWTHQNQFHLAKKGKPLPAHRENN